MWGTNILPTHSLFLNQNLLSISLIGTRVYSYKDSMKESYERQLFQGSFRCSFYLNLYLGFICNVLSWKLRNWKFLTKVASKRINTLWWLNQYDIGRRGCAFMSTVPKANWDREAGRRAVTSKYKYACASQNHEKLHQFHKSKVRTPSNQVIIWHWPCDWELSF